MPSFGGNDSLLQTPPKTAKSEETVRLPKGNLVLTQDDFMLSSPGFPVTVQRLYNSNRKDQLSAFGYGWTFPYDYYIQMFSDFNITEFRSDGSRIKYTFHKNDPDLLVDEYENDPLIYYPLDKGHYTADSNATATLKRSSKDEYRVTRTDGTTYIFQSFSKSSPPRTVLGLS